MLEMILQRISTHSPTSRGLFPQMVEQQTTLVVDYAKFKVPLNSSSFFTRTKISFNNLKATSVLLYGSETLLMPNAFVKQFKHLLANA